MAPRVIQGNRRPKGIKYWPFWIRGTILMIAYLIQYALWIIWYFSMLWLLVDLIYAIAPRRVNRWLDRHFFTVWVGRPPPTKEGDF
ncbi:MAG: hypothetical protein KGO02_11775, partial [Alphaproteobacteria bacterium]|nr:hypothetical protein [Alphaproteobacteria bacterium]